MCALACTLCLYSCGEYQALLKSKDPDLKYQKALAYFNDKQYVKAQTLLDEVTSYYKGTDRSQEFRYRGMLPIRASCPDRCPPSCI